MSNLLNEIFTAIRQWDDSSDEDAADPAKNDSLKAAIQVAKKVAMETYVKRVLDYAKQGYASIEFPTYDDGLGLKPM